MASACAACSWATVSQMQLRRAVLALCSDCRSDTNAELRRQLGCGCGGLDAAERQQATQRELDEARFEARELRTQLARLRAEVANG